MKDIKLPINETYFPKNEGKCPICGKDMMGNFVCLGGGALLKEDENVSKISDELDGFLNLTAHYDDKELYENVLVFNNTKNGQFEIYVCSTDCMRKIFNIFVDKLEEKINKNK